MPETRDRNLCFEISLDELQVLVGNVLIATYGNEQSNDLKQVRQVSEIIENGMCQEEHYADTAEQDDWPVLQEFEGISLGSYLEFCNANGLVDALRSCIKQAKVIFSDIETISAELDYFEDEDVVDDGHVVLRLQVKSSQATVLDEYDDWIDWKVDNLSANTRGYFTLTFHRVAS